VDGEDAPVGLHHFVDHVGREVAREAGPLPFDQRAAFLAGAEPFVRLSPFHDAGDEPAGCRQHVELPAAPGALVLAVIEAEESPAAPTQRDRHRHERPHALLEENLAVVADHLAQSGHHDLAALAPARPFVDLALLVDQGHVLKARVGDEGGNTRSRPIVTATLDEPTIRSGMVFEQRHPAHARRLSQTAEQFRDAVAPVLADDDPGRGIGNGVDAPARAGRPGRPRPGIPWSRRYRCHSSIAFRAAGRAGDTDDIEATTTETTFAE
jgi:hypothetical protein